MSSEASGPFVVRMGLPGYMPDHRHDRRADYLRSTPGERLAEAISLSRSATRLSVAGTTEQSREFDVEAILRALVAGGVEFLVVGSLAVAVHGYPRATQSLDITPRPDAANLERLYGALAALGGNWALQTDHGPVDVMQWPPGAAAYDELDETAVPIDVRGVGVVRFASYEDVVAMKTAAGRRQDEEDLARLREARDED